VCCSEYSIAAMDGLPIGARRHPARLQPAARSRSRPSTIRGSVGRSIRELNKLRGRIFLSRMQAKAQLLHRWMKDGKPNPDEVRGYLEYIECRSSLEIGGRQLTQSEHAEIIQDALRDWEVADQQIRKVERIGHRKTIPRLSACLDQYDAPAPSSDALSTVSSADIFNSSNASFERLSLNLSNACSAAASFVSYDDDCSSSSGARNHLDVNRCSGDAFNVSSRDGIDEVLAPCSIVASSHLPFGMSLVRQPHPFLDVAVRPTKQLCLSDGSVEDASQLKYYRTLLAYQKSLRPKLFESGRYARP
jgi:hypothetical protein